MNELLIILIIVFLLLLSCFSIFYAVKFGLVILRLEDIIEESIDVLDERYVVLSEIASKPIFFDSIEVRQCINEIQKSRDTIQLIAIQLTSVNNIIDKEEVKIEQFKEKSIKKEKEDHTQKERLEKKTLFRP